MTLSPIPELSTVMLRHAVESKGKVVPEGHRGTVVHVWGDGRHYSVEFADIPCVLDLHEDDILLVRAP
jgi:hypothetical protein